MTNELATVDESETLSPAMQALNPRQRNFVEALFETKPGYGQFAEAARIAGYGKPDGSSTPQTMTTRANTLRRSPKVEAAIAEMARKYIRTEVPAAIAAVREI